MAPGNEESGALEGIGFPGVFPEAWATAAPGSGVLDELLHALHLPYSDPCF
jgi:hypothetical protein